MNYRIIVLIYIFLSYCLYENFFYLLPTNIYTLAWFRYLWNLIGVGLYYIHNNENGGTSVADLMNFKKEVIAFMFLPLVSGISAFVNYGQTPIQSFTLWLGSLVWICYFLLHKIEATKEEIIRGMLIISLLVLCFQVYGQIEGHQIGFFYGEQDEPEYRNGLIRIRYRVYFAIFCTFYYWVDFLLNSNKKSLLIVVGAFVSIYLSLTRQLYIATFIPIVIPFLDKQTYVRKSLLRNVFALCFMFYVLWIYRDLLFGFFIERTTSEIENDGNIRIYTAAFYFSDTTQDILRILIGNGIPHEDSALGQYLHYYNQNYGFYPDDVGIIGQWWYYGIIYVLIWIIALYKLLWKYRRKISMPIKMYFWGTLIISYYIFPLAHKFGIIIWILIVYLADVDIKEQNRIDYD